MLRAEDVVITVQLWYRKQRAEDVFQKYVNGCISQMRGAVLRI